MNPERWRQVDQLFQAALEHAPEDRAAFVRAACGVDDSLRREVEALLAADGEAGSLMEAPAYAVVAPMLAGGGRERSFVGKSVHHYQIASLLGKGGMGEVYLAEDTHLRRTVALKVLPADFSNDVDCLRRFEREARAVSSLNHPNIITIHEIGEVESTHYIVTEYVAGETLRQQLNRAPRQRLEPKQAVELAVQIAAALSAAHEAGITHRDIKPENVMVRPDGLVKVLDFGLAKLKPRRFRGKTDSRKISTEPGVVMGTAAYMSPEQVRGEAVDHRSDLFSFGSILVEMLHGERAFQRATMAETMTAILHDEPPELSEAISPQLKQIARRCLEKQLSRRFHSAHDLGFALETLLTANSSDAAAPVRKTAERPKHGIARERTWLIVAGVMTLLALALGVILVRRPAPEAEPLRLSVAPPENATLFDWPAISPDGRTLAFVAEVDGKTQLWVRALDAPRGRPMVEVRDNLPAPFWSPDNRFLAYFEQNKLKKIALAQGTSEIPPEILPEILCDAPGQSSGAWNRDGVILFGNGPAGLNRVSANGGDVTAFTTVDTARGDTGHYSPTFLPDGRHFLYWVKNLDPTKSGVYLASMEGGEHRQILSRLGAWNVGVTLNPANQAEGAEGYLSFVRQGALLAQSFDFSRNQLVGDPVRIAEYVPAPVAFLAHFSLATNGVLVMRESEARQRLTWFDRTGKKLGTIGPAGQYFSPRLSPDEQSLAVGRTNPPAQLDDIHLFDLVSGASTPFTFDPSQDQSPLWSPDGSRLVWTSRREGTSDLFQKAAIGVGQDEVLLRSAFYKSLCDWSTDGRFILYEELNPRTAHDLWVLPMEGERQPWPWLNTPAAEIAARFSPDGKWIAYQSNESGCIEVYVQAFVPGAPASGGKRQLSTNGGKAPRWRRDGRELYYVAADGKLMAAAIAPGAELKAGTPKALFTPGGFQVNADLGYTLTGDGQRFLFVTRAEDAGAPPFTVFLNWMSVVKKR